MTTATNIATSQEIQTPVSGIENQEPKQKKENPPVDALLLAYMFIFESVQINHQSAAIQAKQVESNANAQNRVIRDEEHMNFQLLSEKEKKYKIVVGGGSAAQGEFTKALNWIDSKLDYINPGWGFCPIPVSHFTVHENTSPEAYHEWTNQWKKEGKTPPDCRVTFSVSTQYLNNLELNNQEVSGVRSVMENKLTVLRQSAQVGETNLNSAIDDDQQAVQEGGSLMQMLNSLTQQITRI